MYPTAGRTPDNENERGLARKGFWGRRWSWVVLVGWLLRMISTYFLMHVGERWSRCVSHQGIRKVWCGDVINAGLVS